MKLHTNKILFNEAIIATAQRQGIKEIFVEKDYWVTQILKEIFTNEIGKELETDYYTNYTFVANMNVSNENYLTNYVLTVFNDTLFYQMLVKYPIIADGTEIMYDMENINAESILGEMLVNQKSWSDCDGTISWSWYETEYECTLGAGCTGDICNGEWTDPYTVITWVPTCTPIPLDAILDTDPSGGGGGYTNGNVDDINDGEGNLVVGTTPFDGKEVGENKRNRECLKIKNIINDYPLFMDKVRDLKNKDSLTFETSVAVFDDNSIGEYQGVANNSTVETLPTSPTSDYISMAHVHNENANIKSYSVPSLGDLQWIARRYKDGYLNTSKFTAFLATADGTYFALTINNPTKLWEFFRYMDATNLNITLEKRQEAGNKLAEVYKPILKKYYDDELALIKENAQGFSNNAQQLIYFMQFLEEADAGITVFESDENFSIFTKLSINGFKIERSTIPCQL